MAQDTANLIRDEATTEEIDQWSAASSRKPWLGLGLLISSIVFTLAVLIFFGAWFADGRIADRASAAGHDVEGEWWEDGLITVCPIH